MWFFRSLRVAFLSRANSRQRVDLTRRWLGGNPFVVVGGEELVENLDRIK